MPYVRPMTKGSESADAPARKTLERHQLFFRSVIWSTALLGVALVIIGAVLSEQREELWIEIAKVGIQLLVIGIIGGALSAGWKLAEERRSEQRRLAEEIRSEQRRLAEEIRSEERKLAEERRSHERRQFDLDLETNREIHQRQLGSFMEVVAAYNGVKSVRRTLKSLGLKTHEGVMDELQVAGFHAQMARLNELQLVFEAMVRELGETALFGDDTDAIVTELNGVERYLNRVLEIWEENGSTIRSGSPTAPVAHGLSGLISGSRFASGVVERRQRLTEAMHNHLFGIVSPDKLNELAELEAKD
jgi:hypothetical protein